MGLAIKGEVRISGLRVISLHSALRMVVSGGSLAHVQLSQGTPDSSLDTNVSSWMALAGGSGIASISTCTSKAKICDTGEPLSSKVLQQLQTLEFVELHEFLPAPLLRALESTDKNPST